MKLAIRKYRQKRGLSQQSLAKMIGKKRPVIAKYELGLCNITARDLFRIAQALEITDLPLSAFFVDSTEEI